MAKKSKKSLKSTKSTKYDPRPILCHPSTWIATVLALALFVVYGLSMYGLSHVETKTDLEKAELALFDHLATGYIQNMDFTTDFDKPTIKQITGYGISDEDGVLYITFDFAAQPTAEDGLISEQDIKHAIIYFQYDDERGTYGHAFSYPPDPSDHPSGPYVKLSE